MLLYLNTNQLKKLKCKQVEREKGRERGGKREHGKEKKEGIEKERDEKERQKDRKESEMEVRKGGDIRKVRGGEK